MNPYLALLIGLAAAALGGELFVRGAVGLARALRVPAGIIGATVAAFATSSPELSVAINASTGGKPEIALGDALGSNVVNVALILGLALLFGPLHAPRSAIRRDYSAALFIPVITAILALDGTISQLDAAAHLVIFAFWLIITLKQAIKERSAAAEILDEPKGRALLFSALGLAFLIFAGNFIVTGAKGIGDLFGLDPFIVGATLVAFGTSAPELATTLISRIRGHDEVGLGTVLGSNIFNGVFIVGIAGLIRPIPTSSNAIILAYATGIITILAVLPNAKHTVPRWRGALLLALYASYVALFLALET